MLFIIEWMKLELIQTIQIQTRDVRDHIGKKKRNTGWKIIIMFDHEGVKTMKKFQFSFWMSTLKKLVTKKIWGFKGQACTTPINLSFFKSYSTNIFKWIFNVIFPPRCSVFEAHFQEPSILHEVKIAMGILAQNLE